MQTSKNPRLFLVDVSSLFFRAFYAVRPLTSPNGIPVNAIYGYLSMILKLLKEENPEYIVFCNDTKEPSFRKEIYEDYKAHRTEMPEDLVPQIPYIKKLAEMLGISSVELVGFEADDLIGTLADAAAKKKFDVYIVSGDKDFAQLVNEHVFMFDTMKDATIDAQGVKAKWGVEPRQFIDYLALVGDSSDNVPGVAGVGPKGAQKLIEEFGTLDGIFQNLDKIKSESLRAKLMASKDNAFLSKKIVKIELQVPIETEIENYRRRPVDRVAMSNLLSELNFKSFEKSILTVSESLPGGPASSSAPAPAKTASLPEPPPPSPALQDDPLLGIEEVTECDLEQLGVRIPTGADVWLLQAAQGFFLGHDRSLYRLSQDLIPVGQLFDLKKWKYKGHDLKTFWHLLKPQNPEAAWDSMLAAYLIKPGEKMDFSQLVPRFLGKLLSDLPTPRELYEAHLNLERVLNQKICEAGTQKVLKELDLPVVKNLYWMEERGIRLDKTVLELQSAELGKEIHVLEKKIHELAGESFNIGSPKQLAQILFTKMKLPPSKKTKTGFSTDNDVLESLKESHPIAELLLSYRELTKLKSTYVDALPALVAGDGRIHTHFHQALTATGRLSSTEPNLQNIPIRTDRGSRIRRAFVADQGKVLLSIDYSQIELRILAHYSSDKNLCKAFEEDLDIHSATAAEVFGVDLKHVTADMRRTAKAVNFGIAYGQGAFGLAENLGIPRAEASDIIKRYFEKFAGVKDYIEATIALVERTGFVETLAGRRRYIDEIHSKNAMLKKFGERAAINAPIQGTASDIMKKAMIEVDRFLANHNETQMLLQVHDELIFEGPKEGIRSSAEKIKTIMEGVEQLRVPLKANIAIGPNWEEAK